MKDETSAKDHLLIMLAANIAFFGFLILAGWFAYIENGYWGWPFAMACLSASGFKSWKAKKQEEREEAIERQKTVKKYGDIFKN